MDFQQRLEKAIQRGEYRRDAKTRAAQAKAISAEELKSLHSRYRLQVSEHIEKCIEGMQHHFPGFQFESIYGERGWGAGCQRDDFGGRSAGSRNNQFSRLELTVRPHSPASVLELTGKGTIRNKEVFNHRHFEKLSDVDVDGFIELIDFWVLEFAEMFAASK